MAASAFKAEALVFKDPSLSCATKTESLAPSAAFGIDVGNNIQTISSKSIRNSEILGLLYVPSLPPNNQCDQDLEPDVPQNVTRLTDLHYRSCVLIAVAPWVASDCTQYFLLQASQDRASAVVVYLPGNSTDKPPPADDPIWSLEGDGQWKSQYKFPVFAIPGASGALLMDKMAQYSRKLSDVPNHDRLLRVYGENATARVYGAVGLEAKRGGIPNFWMFLLVILAALIIIIGGSSLLMKYLQYRRRVSLRRRIVAGEVDLETLGIRRLRVPAHVLEKMPLYTYDKDEHPSIPAPAHVSERPETESNIAEDANKMAIPSSSDQIPFSQTPYERLKSSFSQTTCPICLDDYVSGESTVRELSCQHIFHPECIDAFLLQNSSLCPVCKKSVFPAGYCPEVVTDAMVRQERSARRPSPEGASGDTRLHNLGSSWRHRLGIRSGHSRPPNTENEPAATEHSTHGSAPNTPTDRREMMRRRAVAMLGSHRTAEDDEHERDSARPKWIKLIHAIFPTLR